MGIIENKIEKNINNNKSNNCINSKRGKMEVKADSNKRLFYIPLLGLALILLVLGANAVVDTTKSWHPLQQVAKSDTDITSVDENNNKIIDEAETLSLVGGVATIGNPASSTALAIKGVGTGWAAIDFYSGNTNLWGMGRDSSGYFYIDRTGVGRALTIDASRNVGIGTASPSNPLTVKSNSAQLRLETNSDPANYYTTLQALYNSNHPFSLTVANNGIAAEYLGVYADGGSNNRVVFPTGNVGIGTTAPTQKLDVAGNIKLSGSIFGSGSTSNYGALTIDGSKNGWSGINFKSGGTNYGTFMVHPDYSGVYNNLDNNWDWYFQNGVLQVGSIPWSLLTSVPAGLSDGDQMGITSESDPTVPAYVKDGTSWGEISGIPAGFADNVDSGGPSNNCRIVYGQIGSRAMCAEDEYMRGHNEAWGWAAGVGYDIYCCKFS